MTPIDAYHLPGLGESDLQRWEVREYDGGALRIRFPVLTPATLERVVARLREARARHLAGTPVLEVVRAIDRAAAHFQSPGSPARDLAEAALPALTGYSPEMIRLILDRMAADWREPALLALLESELGDPGVLDGFRERGGSPVMVRAFGPELAFHIFAGNVPGVAVTSLIRALLVKAASLGKAASGEPLLAALFARTLAEVEPRLGECSAVTYWPGGAAALEEVALREADTTIVYGGGETVRSVRARVPAGARVVEHGPRLSLAVVAREELAGDSARRVAAEIARATATFDQQGCVSPHMVYLERGGELEPAEFAALVAEGLERIEEVLPRGQLTAEEAATIQQVRGAAEFRAIAGREVRVLASEGTEYTVIYEDDPAFTTSCLNRVIRLAPLDDLAQLPTHLEPYRAYLQTVGVAASPVRRRDVAGRLGAIGVSRVTTIEAMPWPPPAWHHDGQEPLRELLRWTDLEG